MFKLLRAPKLVRTAPVSLHLSQNSNIDSVPLKVFSRGGYHPIYEPIRAIGLGFLGGLTDFGAPHLVILALLSSDPTFVFQVTFILLSVLQHICDAYYATRIMIRLNCFFWPILPISRHTKPHASCHIKSISSMNSINFIYSVFFIVKTKCLSIYFPHIWERKMMKW